MMVSEMHVIRVDQDLDVQTQMVTAYVVLLIVMTMIHSLVCHKLQERYVVMVIWIQKMMLFNLMGVPVHEHLLILIHHV